MKIDRARVKQFKEKIKGLENSVYVDIVTKGTAEQKIAIAELGKYLEELSKDESADVRIAAVLNGANPLEMVMDEDENVRFAVLRALDQAMKRQHILLFKTYDKYGEIIYFVIPSKARRAVEEMTKDESEKVSNLAKSILNWQRARDCYERSGFSSDEGKDLYLKRAYKKLQEGEFQPVLTCTQPEFLEQFD